MRVTALKIEGHPVFSGPEAHHKRAPTAGGGPTTIHVATVDLPLHPSEQKGRVMTTTHRRTPSTTAWMSLEDLCDELGISRDTAYKWSSSGPASGRFPEYRKLPNGQIRIRRDWFEEWVNSLGPAA